MFMVAAMYIKTGHWELVISCSLFWAAFLVSLGNVETPILFAIANVGAAIMYFSVGYRLKDEFYGVVGFIWLFMAVAHIIP